MSTTFGLIMALYSANRSGEIQVESFGAAVSSIYALLLAYLYKRTYLPSKKMIFIFMLLNFFSIGLKEPFFFVNTAIALTFSNSVLVFFYIFILPIVMTVLFGLLVLLCLKWLIPFFTIYLDFVFNNYIQGSPWERGLKYNYVLNDLNNFSYGMGYLVIMLLAVYLYICARHLYPKNLKNIIKSVLVNFMKVMLIIYLSVLAIGVGERFYNHYYVYTVPVYIALFLFIIGQYKKQKRGVVFQNVIILLLVVVMTICTYNLPKINYDVRIQSMKQGEKIIRFEAEYVDTVLDISNQDRYLFLGKHGLQLYAFTKHSPMGPVFFQFNDWMELNSGTFRKEVINALMKINLVVVDSYQLNEYNRMVKAYLNENFSDIPWEKVRGVERRVRRYKIYFRNNI